MTDRADIKRRLHCARINLAYRLKHASSEVIAATEAEVARLKEEFDDSSPERITLRVRSPYFIGPRLKRGARGDGPTITCFRCGEEKPREEFYSKGTVCKACVVKRSAEWAEKNPEKCKEAKQRYAEENREEINAKQRDQYWENPESAREYNRIKYKKHSKKRCIHNREYMKARKKRDPAFRAFINCKRRMYILMKGAGVKKCTRSAELIGLPRDQFLKYIESLWLPGMNWKNYGKGSGMWVIDHIIPAVSFDRSKVEEQKKCWHYTNLRPLWDPDNSKKSDALPDGTRARDKKFPLTAVAAS